MVGCPGCGKAFEAHPPGVPPKPPPPDTYHAEEPVRPPAYEYGRESNRPSPRYDDDDDDYRDEKRQRQRRKERKAAAMCLAPGIVFICAAVVNMAVGGFFVLGHMSDIRSNEKDEFTVPSLIVHTASIVASIVIVLGGIQMIRLQTWGLGIAASILCLIPGISPCCIMGIPCGVWGLVVLCNGKVKESFT